uniref:Putative secreted protein n=1 Tax=Anopheles triannulatus TaxID=58253 RepID=A0A2M4B4S5_9DIPT
MMVAFSRFISRSSLDFAAGLLHSGAAFPSGAGAASVPALIGGCTPFESFVAFLSSLTAAALSFFFSDKSGFCSGSSSV